MAKRSVWRNAPLLVLLVMAVTGSLPEAAATPSERYIVVFNDSVADAAATASEQAVELGGRVVSVYRHAFEGYAGTFSPEAVSRLRLDGRVRMVERDRRVRVDSVETIAKGSPLWGLDRIDQRALPLSGGFGYAGTGAGVTAYVIDSGIRYDHSEFGGRAVPGIDILDRRGNAGDCDGHGTHVAGIIGGALYGAAKQVTLKSVRVLDCRGETYVSDIIRGVDWVTADHQHGMPAVANISLGGGTSSALDDAVRRSIADGVNYTVSAGNGDRRGAENACDSSPGRLLGVMTIGASDNRDRRASWSNYGNCVDWFAPGVSIRSASIRSATAKETWSGTSMAAPHTAGVAALYLQSHPSASPSQVKSALLELTTKGIVSRAKSANNHLLFTDL